jgi:hypothetical protein
MMKHGSTILKYGSDASVVEADDITSRDVSALEQNQEIQEQKYLVKFKTGFLT